MSIWQNGITIIISPHGPGRDRSIHISALGLRVITLLLLLLLATVLYLGLIYGRVYYLAIQSARYRRMNEEMKRSIARLEEIRIHLRESDAYRRKLFDLLGIKKTPPPINLDEILGVGSSSKEALVFVNRSNVPSILPVRGFISRGYTPDHPAIDIAASEGTPVVAPADGFVRDVGWDSIYGNYIIIDHGKYSTFFGHLYQSNAAIGEKVATGKVIGYVGSTGISSSPHLHYEVRLNGRPVDPRTYFIR